MLVSTRVSPVSMSLCSPGLWPGLGRPPWGLFRTRKEDVPWLRAVRALLASVQLFTGGRRVVLVAVVWPGHFSSGRFEVSIFGVCRGCQVTQLKWPLFT